MPTLTLHINGPLHSNTVIGTLAVDGWAVTFGTAKRGSVPTSYCSMWHHNCLWTLKGSCRTYTTKYYNTTISTTKSKKV